MDKRQKLVAQIRQELGRKTTQELLAIWIENNHHVWSEEAFEAIQQELTDRRVDIPAQDQKIDSSHGVETWTVAAMKRDIKRWGALLVVIGAAQLLLKGTMYLEWAVVLLVLGVAHIFVSHHSIYLVDSMLCLAVALIDVGSGNPIGWTLSVILFLWAFMGITKFSWYHSSKERQTEVLIRLGRLPKDSTPEDIAKMPAGISPRKVKKLIAQLEQDREWIDWMYRKDAADALGELGSMARDAVPALESALEDEKKDVRQAAAQALVKIRENGSGNN